MLGLLSLFNKFINKYLKNFSDSISNMVRIKTDNPLSQSYLRSLKKVKSVMRPKNVRNTSINQFLLSLAKTATRFRFKM